MYPQVPKLFVVEKSPYTYLKIQTLNLPSAQVACVTLRLPGQERRLDIHMDPAATVAQLKDNGFTWGVAVSFGMFPRDVDAIEQQGLWAPQGCRGT